MQCERPLLFSGTSPPLWPGHEASLSPFVVHLGTHTVSQSRAQATNAVARV